jgi:hypothetical protein
VPSLDDRAIRERLRWCAHLIRLRTSAIKPHLRAADAVASPGSRQAPKENSGDEWLVGHGYLSAEAISLVLAAPNKHTNMELKGRCPSAGRP